MKSYNLLDEDVLLLLLLIYSHFSCSFLPLRFLFLSFLSVSHGIKSWKGRAMCLERARVDYNCDNATIPGVPRCPPKKTLGHTVTPNMFVFFFQYFCFVEIISIQHTHTRINENRTSNKRKRWGKMKRGYRLIIPSILHVVPWRNRVLRRLTAAAVAWLSSWSFAFEPNHRESRLVLTPLSYPYFVLFLLYTRMTVCVCVSICAW